MINEDWRGEEQVSKESIAVDLDCRPLRGPEQLADLLDEAFEQNYRFEGLTNVLQAPKRFFKSVVSGHLELEDSDFMKKR